MNRKRYKVIACEVLCREICALAAVSPHTLDIQFLPQGLHNIGKKKMRQYLETALNTVDETKYDAILLGYALCNGGITELTAKTIPLVVPKAHDCITLFLGSRKCYEDYFFSNPGTYFETAGWIERGNYEEKLCTEMMPFYTKYTFITTGIETDDSFEKETQRRATCANWEYEKMQGDLTLLRRLLYADWNEDFLIVQPGKKIQFSYDENVIKVEG